MTPPPAYGYVGQPQQRRKDRSWIWIVVAISATLMILMGACYVKLNGQGKVSDVAVAQFHKQMDAGECDAIYMEASPEFGKAVTLNQWRSMCEGLPKKMGSHVRSSREQVGFNSTLNGTYINAIYSSEFSQGKGRERFTWKKDGDRVRLVGYFINSPNLAKSMFDNQ